MKHLIFTLHVLSMSAWLAASAPAQQFTPNNIFVASTNGSKVVEFTPAGAKVRDILTGADSGPWGVAFSPNGELLVSCSSDNVVRRYNSAGAFLGEFGSAQLSTPENMAFGPNGNLYVVSFGNDRVVEFKPDGTFVKNIGTGTTMNGPAGITVSPDGHLWVSTFFDDKCYEFDAGGQLIQEFSIVNMLNMNSIAVHPNGNLIMPSSATNTLFLVNANGTKTGEIGSGLDFSQFGMAIGPDALLYVSKNAEIVIFEPIGGSLVRSFGSGDLSFPGQIAFAPFRFKANISSKLGILQDANITVKEAAIVSYSSGTRQIFVQLTDDPGNNFDLTTFFGSTALVFTGFESFGTDRKKGGMFQGFHTTSRSLINGGGSLEAAISWSLVPSVNFVTIKKITGTVSRMQPTGNIQFKLSTGPLLK